MGHKLKYSFLLTLLLVLFSLSNICVAQDTSSLASSKSKSLVYDLFDQIFESAENAEGALLNGSSNERPFQFFGWHAHWLKSSFEQYQYDLITSVSFYGIDVLPDEGVIYFNDNGWSNPKYELLVELAQQEGCNVLVTFNIKGQAVQSVLTDSEEQAYLINKVKEVVSGRDGVNGINLVLKNVPLGLRSELSSLMKALSEELHAMNKILVVAVPGIPNTKKYDFQTINEYVDQFVMQGYNYYPSKSKTPGPIAPLRSGEVWGDYNLELSVDGYLKAGISKSKFILGLPYFGGLWRVDTLNGNLNYTFKGNPRFGHIERQLDTLIAVVYYDSISVSSWYTYVGADNQRFVCFYDDVANLRTKINWARSKGIRGVGAWSLGYDRGSNKMWNLLREHINVEKDLNLSNDFQPITAVDLSKTNLASLKCIMIKIMQQKEVIIVLVIMLFGFVALGCIKAFMAKDVYDRLLITDLLTYFRIVGGIIILVLIGVVVASVAFYSESELNQIYGEKSAKISSDTLCKVILYLGFIFIMTTSILSWKAFLKFNKDIP